MRCVFELTASMKSSLKGLKLVSNEKCDVN